MFMELRNHQMHVELLSCVHVEYGTCDACGGEEKCGMPEEGKDYLENIGLGGRIILNWIP
jgi:hypothetical protein